MKVVFADTYYDLAVVSPNDAGHERATTFSRGYRGRVLTTPGQELEPDGLHIARRHGAPRNQGIADG
jgi:hypothetical protein